MCGEFFDPELSIFAEHVVGLGATVTSVMDPLPDPHTDLSLLSARLVVILRTFPVVRSNLLRDSADVAYLYLFVSTELP